jgi:hypothetical protein
MFTFFSIAVTSSESEFLLILTRDNHPTCKEMNVHVKGDRTLK